MFRDSRSEMFFKTGGLKNFRKNHKKTPVLESLIDKVARLKPRNFIKKRVQHRRFPVNIAKLIRTVFLHNTPGGCL